jgi:putative tryptophan/tyrosine transport system substrate-binding protein
VNSAVDGWKGVVIKMKKGIARWGFTTIFLAVSFSVYAQQANKIPRIGFLGNSTAALEANLVGPFREGLRDLGYVEGRNILIEYRWAEGKYDRFPALIAELLALNVDLIVTAGTPATQAFQKTKAAIPLVMVAVGDPVGTGIIASLNRPGGNITGLTSISPELEGKRIELLREVVPKLSHIAVMWNPANAYHESENREAQAAAAALRIKVLFLGVKDEGDFEAAFGQILKQRPEALLVLAGRVFLHNRARIMDFAVQKRLAGIYAYVELVEAGGLMSYGPSYADMHRRAAMYVDKILKGAKPTDLPVERPLKFELVINLKAAKQIGLTIPPNVLARADRVIK